MALPSVEASGQPSGRASGETGMTLALTDSLSARRTDWAVGPSFAGLLVSSAERASSVMNCQNALRIVCLARMDTHLFLEARWTVSLW